MSGQDECPVCEVTLPSNAKSKEANEAHVAACIASRLSNNLSIQDTPAPQSSGDDECPVCHVSFLSKQMSNSMQDREAHVAACIEKATNSSDSKTDKPPMYRENDGLSKSSMPKPLSDEKGFLKDSKGSVDEKGFLKKKKEDSMASSNADSGSLTTQRPSLASTPSGRRPSGFKSFLSKLGPDKRPQGEKTESNIAKAEELMYERWGPPGSAVRQMVERYWIATRMQQHWDYLREQHPRQFRRHLGYGYMEPIPTKWVRDRRLAYLNPEFSTFETPAEERLYYLLNNGVMPDGSQHPPLRPLNITRDMYRIIQRGNERNARQVRLNPQQLLQYQSRADVFHSDRQIKSQEYSYQVPNVVYSARSAALHELADGILHGTDHLETMLLVDVSGSMTWNPHGGMVGPDGLRRFHDQPANILLVEHLVHRVLNHMIPRAQREHPHQTGIDSCIFSSQGTYVGQLTAHNFRQDWHTRVRRNLGGGTQVMQGWQCVKQTYFAHQHREFGHGRFDPVYGWQATPGMPKLSLLVFLDGEAQDMDEFELELLGETWAYVTIALVGMENCPHHHSHAIELERVARFNPHVGFFDVHGRVCERMVVEDLLGSVYPVDPPKYEEILKPEYDLKQEEDLPGYSA